MTAKTEITSTEFNQAIEERQHQTEAHFAWGTVLEWYIDAVTYEKHKLSIGKIKYFKRA